MDIKNMQKISQVLGEIAGEVCKERKVLKSVPIRKEWKPILKELKEAREESAFAEQKATSLKRLFWSTVEKDLNDFGHGMKINDETDEIEILEDED